MIKKFVFFIILTYNHYVKAELIGVKEPTQIVGGAPAPEPGQFPYQVGIIIVINYVLNRDQGLLIEG